MENLTGAQIIQYNYKGETVFMINSCYMCPDALAVVYGCDGEIVCEFGGFAGLNTCPDFYSLATDSLMLWNNVEGN
ncbi:MAG: hypothetical protein JXA77_15015 [Bacteroidales bacterium]|nr:hypothetical protein [Bacteroidales bacterium]MBN2818922.1 hypothetical protein [Bacteroidales bacterium]